MLLYEKVLRVPLIVAGPRVSGGSVDRPVSLADVAPTILVRAGLQAPPAMTGMDLLAPGAVERETYSETVYPRAAGWSAVHALASERWKLVQTGTSELYDLASDADERQNVADVHTGIVAAMQKTLARLEHDGDAGRPASASDAEVAERLRSLGYVTGSSATANASSDVNPAHVVDAWVAFEDALALMKAGQPARAVVLLEQITRQHPESRIFHATYASALAQAGHATRALDIYRRSVARWPRDPDLYHGLAIAARDTGRSSEALKAEQAALAINPTHAPAQDGLGLLAIDAGRFSEAAAAFERATALDPTNVSYWVNLGNARREVGNMTAAEAGYKRALDLDARSPDAANGLGVVLVQTGKAADAIQWFERAVGAAPEFYEAKLNLGIAYQQAGRSAEAATAYRAVLDAPPRFKRERDAASKLLASLK
jgi:tetratricopeptide (TPR) repeat protein